VTTFRGVLYCITHMTPHWFMLENVESLLDTSDEDDEQRSDLHSSRRLLPQLQSRCCSLVLLQLSSSRNRFC